MVRKTATAKAAAEVLGTEHQANDAAAAQNLINEMLKQLSPTRRDIVALVANLVTMGATAYAGIQVSAVLMVGAVSLTGSAFLAFMVMFLGTTLSIFMAMWFGAKVNAWVLDHGPDRLWSSTKQLCDDTISHLSLRRVPQ